MVKKRDRTIAMFLAILFLATSSALTIGVVYQMVQGNKKPSSSSPSRAANSKEVKMDNANKLQGTKLTNFTPVANIPQLQEVDSTPGTGDSVKAGDTVTVDYTGAVASTGVVFQSSKDSGQPIPLPLKSGSVIDGFVKGVPGMKVGGTRRLLIPAAQAYGANSPDPSIPANADLVFDVTVHKIGK